MGIIETLTAGFDLVRRKPWLILLPVVLSVGLWLVPRLPMSSMVNEVVLGPASHPGAYAGLTPSPEDVDPAQAQLVAIPPGLDDLRILLYTHHVLIPILPVPTRAGLLGRASRTVDVNGALAPLVLVAGLSLANLVLGALFLAPIAQEVAETGTGWQALLRGFPRRLLRLFAAYLLTKLLLTFILLPALVATAFMPGLGPLYLTVLVTFAGAALLWAQFHLFFVPYAIMLGGEGVLRAVTNSINVMRSSFWSVLGLLALAVFIMFGLGALWSRLATETWGAFAAIVANAFVGTGLTAAVFIFYRERMRAWEQLIKQLRSQA